MEDLIHVIYLGAASPELPEHDTVKFLNEVRKANRQNDISGMMLYVGGCLLLLLEGTAADIDSASRTISADERKLRMILREPIPEREFPEWASKRSSPSKPAGCSVNGCCSILLRASLA
jgi:hypothetical protein